MEAAVRDNDFVVVVCTPPYKIKSDTRSGGVGYEGGIMTGEVFALGKRRKFVPVLASGEWIQAAPAWLLGCYYVDLRGERLEANYKALLDTLHSRRAEAPPVSAQSFKVLDEGSVLDLESNLVWANCGDDSLHDWDEAQRMLEQLGQTTGLMHRLPTEEEIRALNQREQDYVRKPVLVELRKSVPFIGDCKFHPWTATYKAMIDSQERPTGAHCSDIARMFGVDSEVIALAVIGVAEHRLFRAVRPRLQGE
jgi:hypothetical protein